MKKFRKSLILSSLLLGALGLVASLGVKQNISVKADQEYTTPRGTSGTILLVSGDFASADLAIYCFNNDSDNAWSEKSSYRMGNGLLRVMIPYQNGNSKTWSKFIVTRYDKNKDPQYDGWGGVYNQTNDISFSSFMYYQNTVLLNGYDDQGKMTYQLNASYYYGVKGENHIYLDLTNFPNWEDGNAKFALYFAYPSQLNEEGWTQAYRGDYYARSFLWKVEGQSNPHLYEGIVPNILQGGANLWNMVIAVRFNPNTPYPAWVDNGDVWNKTQDLIFTSSNHNSNIIRINDWNSGELLDQQYSISKETRIGFFGQYFLDTVTCSGTGNTDATTSTMWNNVKAAYNHLARGFQGTVWTTVANVEGTIIQQAMARYDYIVLYKQYNHEDFINRADPNSGADHSVNNSLVIDSIDNNEKMTLIIILASIMTLSVITLIVLKKYKTRRR